MIPMIEGGEEEDDSDASAAREVSEEDGKVL
jgi:hypothetical protein